MVKNPWVKMVVTGVASVFGVVTAGAVALAADKTDGKKGNITTQLNEGKQGPVIHPEIKPPPKPKYGIKPKYGVIVEMKPDPCMKKKCKADQKCVVVNGKAKCKSNVIVEIAPKYGVQPPLKYGPKPPTKIVEMRPPSK
jgi:hypothetical protein